MQKKKALTCYERQVRLTGQRTNRVKINSLPKRGEDGTRISQERGDIKTENSLPERREEDQLISKCRGVVQTAHQLTDPEATIWSAKTKACGNRTYGLIETKKITWSAKKEVEYGRKALTSLRTWGNTANQWGGIWHMDALTVWKKQFY